ncbi:retrovirus-related pol polyprotein from transposon TNT 1-94 [Tanacetum coccineum]
MEREEMRDEKKERGKEIEERKEEERIEGEEEREKEGRRVVRERRKKWKKEERERRERKKRMRECGFEQAFWLKHSNYNPDTSVKSHTPVRIEASSKLPKSCVDECNKCLKLETELLKKKDLIKKDVYDKLLKSYSTLEKHCVSLELTTQLNQEIFQKDNFCENQYAPTFNQLFIINELKGQSQEKDTIIRKLKDRIKSLSGKDTVENVKKDIDEIETINIELEHSVAKLLSENENLRKEREHLKSIYKDKFDSIRKTRVQSNEHCASLISQINEKSVENLDLNAQLQEKIFATAAFATIAPGMFKLDIETISHRLKNNRDAHEVYLEKTIENTDTLRGLVECARKQNPSEPLLESGCMFIKHIQELLVYVYKTCPSLTKPTKKLVAVTPMNKDKKVRFVEPVTSSSNIPKQTDSLKTKDSNKPLLTSTGVKPTTSASGSKPSGNTKNNRITRPPSSNQKNKVEEHPRNVKSSLNKKNSISEPISKAIVKHFVRNAKFESMCAICNKRLFDANHDMCLVDYVNDVNVCSKSKSKRNKIRKVWKPTALKVYSGKPKASRSVGSSSKAKIVESKTSNTKEPKQSWGFIVSDVPSSSIIDFKLFGNDHIAKIMGYGDYQIGNVTISQVYYVEGLCHNLFSVGHFCDSDLEVAFRKHTCFIRDLEGVDLLKGSRGSNLYTLSMDNLLLSSPICLLSKASKTKSWLWHRRLSHLNFDYINSLAKQGLVQGPPKLKYQKDHLPMRVQSINGRKYILVIVDDFSRFTWVKFLRSKADIGIFVGYAPAKKAFRIYNKRTRMIIETIHVDFDELTTMASEQFSLGPRHKLLTPKTISSGLVQNIPSSTSYVPPTKNDWDILFQPMFDEYLNPPSCVDPQVLTVIAPEHVVSTGTPS